MIGEDIDIKFEVYKMTKGYKRLKHPSEVIKFKAKVVTILKTEPYTDVLARVI